MGNEQGRRVKDYAKTGVSAGGFRTKERGKRVKDRAKNGARMEDRGTGFSVLAAREMKRGPFFARSSTLVPHSLLLNCTKRLLRRLGVGPRGDTSSYKTLWRRLPRLPGRVLLARCEQDFLPESSLSSQLPSLTLTQASKPLLAQFMYHWNFSIQKGGKFPYFNKTTKPTNKTAFVHNFSLLNTTERTTCTTVF